MFGDLILCSGVKRERESREGSNRGFIRFGFGDNSNFKRLRLHGR